MGATFPTVGGAGALDFPTQPAPEGSPGEHATGQVDLSGGGPGSIGFSFTIYGKVFRLIVGGVPAPSPGEVAVDFASDPNAGVVLVNAINGAGIGITAVQSAPSSAIANLTGPASSAGNDAITTDAPGVVVSGMSGGVDPTSSARTAPFSFPTV